MNGPRSPLAILAAALGLAAVARAQETEDPGRIFHGRCASCHPLPDRELRGDRAWLGQVHETA